jgi:hypothetical protein
VLVSAADAGRLFDLRCLVRERLVGRVQGQDEAALPRRRLEMVGRGGEPGDGTERGDRPGLFSGDAAGDARAERFARGEPQHADDPAE